ncbi:MAG: hemerythrin domain-containing protein [Terriglobia bacterium]
MARFSQFFASEQTRIERWAAIPEPIRQPEEIFRIADKGKGLDAEAAASLFAAARDQNLRNEIRDTANRVRARFAQKTVESIIPVYLTSFCQNECLYCGYRKSNPIAERVRLGLEDFEKQLDLILSWGHRQIELVLSDDPEFGPETVARYVASTRRKLEARGGGVVALCSPVYQHEDYVRLRDAGLDWVVEWQETYHQPHFDRWHFPGSPKRNFESRLDLWDRVVAAGITKIGMGVLLGLYEFRYDALAVIEHGNYLRRTYGIEPHALGIPRLKPARGVLASQKSNRFTVSDDDFRLVVGVYHMAFPTSRLFFNTRESYELNISLVAAGDLFTVDCETLPGAYLRQHLPGQFSTHDYPPRREVRATLERRGLAGKYLAEETPCEIAPTAPGTAMDEKRWMDQHAQMRARLQDWEVTLDLLSGNGSRAAERQAADATLHEILEYFKTVLTTHGRQEESELFPAFHQDVEGASRLAALRADHERFGVDLDKFERQMVSYGLSRDPTVLLTLGARMIREMRGHLEAEERLSSDLFRGSFASSANADGNP